jgi:NAD-dependent deacetylase
VKQIEQLAIWLRAAERTVFFTGAGISTESGIPDFRSPDGIWARYQPVYFADFMANREARREYWRQKCEAHVEFADAEPNVGHRVIADWEQRGLAQGVITQNIDELHQIAGSQRVLELHGTARRAQCMSCGDLNPIQSFVDAFLAIGEPPTCEKCGGPVKHATISFGQSLDEDVMVKAHDWMVSADLVFALGSSLVVHPAAGLPSLAKQHGAQLVIINRAATPLDQEADMVLNLPLGETLVAIDRSL